MVLEIARAVSDFLAQKGNGYIIKAMVDKIVFNFSELFKLQQCYLVVSNPTVQEGKN